MWNADDSKLISCGTDSAVYEWNLSSGKRQTECVLKSCSYNCVTVSPDAKIIFAVGSDQTLKEIADSSVSLPGLPPSHCTHPWETASMCTAASVMGRGLGRRGPLLRGITSGLPCLLSQLSPCYSWDFLPRALPDQVKLWGPFPLPLCWLM